MIRAFHNTTLLTPDVNKAEYLAEGIYVALVTTLGGLCVAIPAAIFAHHFEGRIQSLFHEVDEMLFNLMPQIERFEGRVRFSRQMGDGEAGANAVGATGAVGATNAGGAASAASAVPPPPPMPEKARATK
jgi:biopolymer transport protein ExbB